MGISRRHERGRIGLGQGAPPAEERAGRGNSVEGGGMASRLQKRLRDESGTSLIEAALITPLFLLLTFAIADFGAVFYA